MANPSNNPQPQTLTKVESLATLRAQIDDLEKNINDAKRNELILAEERSPLKSIYKWAAPERSFTPKDRRWYIIAGAIAVGVILLSILTDNLLLIVAVVAVLALLYAMNTIPPQVFTYEITNKGLRIGAKLYIWKQIPKFWITERGQDIFVNLEVKDADQAKLMLLTGDGNIEVIAKEMVRYIDYLNPNETPGDFFTQITAGRHRSIGEFFQQSKEENTIPTTTTEPTTETRAQ